MTTAKARPVDEFVSNRVRRLLWEWACLATETRSEARQFYVNACQHWTRSDSAERANITRTAQAEIEQRRDPLGAEVMPANVSTHEAVSGWFCAFLVLILLAILTGVAISLGVWGVA